MEEDPSYPSTIVYHGHTYSVDEKSDEEIHHPLVLSEKKYKELVEHHTTLTKKCCGVQQRQADDEEWESRDKRCGCGHKYRRDVSGQLHYEQDRDFETKDLSR